MAYLESTKDHGNRIFLWFNPRSLSTAFAKCVSFMDGAQIWIEPYAACAFNLLFSTPEYLAKFPVATRAKGQFKDAAEEIHSFDHYFDGGNLTPSSFFNYDWVQEQLGKPMTEGKSFMFVKEAAVSIDGFYDKLPKVPFRHTFITRDPCRTAKSLRSLCKSAAGHDGDSESYDMYEGNPFLDWDQKSTDPLYSLWKYVKGNLEPNPVVIDADDLQSYPEQILREYCQAVGIPFKQKYLEWPESDKSLKYCYGSLDQMVWGKKQHVYDTAFASSRFKPISAKKPAFEDLTADAQRYIKDKQTGYEEMYITRLRPNV